jgi:glutaredoxin-like protein
MALIPEREADRLRAYFATALIAPVHADLYVIREQGWFRTADACASCGQAQILLEEIAALSDRIWLSVHSMCDERALAAVGVDRVPTLVLSGPGSGGVRFVGAPVGEELVTLLEDLVDLSRGSTDLDADSRRALAGLAREVRVQVLVSHSCPWCPDSARAAHKLAMASSRVTAEVIGIDEFPELADALGVRGVPTVLIDGAVALEGAQPITRLVEAVVAAAGRPPQRRVQAQP